MIPLCRGTQKVIYIPWGFDMSKVKIGDKFGDLTVISNAGGEHWLCKCVCGGEKLGGLGFIQWEFRR